MESKVRNQELSYKAHIENIKGVKKDLEARLRYLENKKSIYYYNISRPLLHLNSLFDNKSNWLTVGDFIGQEANYILSHKQEATASDISRTILEEVKKHNYINNFLELNCEEMNLNDNSYDYILCKEAFHHFPRAYMGIYEMIRCCKKGCVIIEPTDVLSKIPLLVFLKNICDLVHPKLINKLWKNRFSFEIVGNYVFKISEREVEKIAMGLQLPCIAFKGINIILDLKLDKEEALKVPLNKTKLFKLNLRIRLLNFFSFIKLIPYNHLTCVIFKEMPSESKIKELKNDGFKVIKLPPNPYV